MYCAVCLHLLLRPIHYLSNESVKKVNDGRKSHIDNLLNDGRKSHIDNLCEIFAEQ